MTASVQDRRVNAAGVKAPPLRLLRKTKLCRRDAGANGTELRPIGTPPTGLAIEAAGPGACRFTPGLWTDAAFLRPSAVYRFPRAAERAATSRSFVLVSADDSLVEETSSAPVLSKISFARLISSEVSQ